MWAVKHKSGNVLFVTNCERTANNRREMGWIVKEVKMTSREQFDDFVRENLHPGASNAVIRLCWRAWQASREAIEIELPEHQDPADFFCAVYSVDGVISALNKHGLKVKA